MSIGNIVKSSFVGIALGGVIGSVIGVDDSVGEALRDTGELISESANELTEMYEQAPEGATQLFKVKEKINIVYPDLADKIEQDVLPQGAEWLNISKFAETVPDKLPSLTEDVIANANLTPADVAGYTYASDNIKQVANIIQDNMGQVGEVVKGVEDEVLAGAAVGGGIFGIGSAVKDVPQWTEKVAQSIGGGAKSKGK
jgi:gas vesicle protein